MRASIEQWLQRAPIPGLRDVVEKRPSSGANVDVLDGIRGLAFLFVLASHTGAFGQHGHGAVGVWLFFTLSAFLLTLPFARDPAQRLQPSRLWHYAGRRVRRILPAYYVLLLVWYLATDFGTAPFVAHLLFLRGDIHLWSIPQEMLFYLLLPGFALLHLFVFRRNTRASALGMAALAILASFFLEPDLISLQGNGRPQRFFLGVFLSGMAAAFAYCDPAVTRFAARPSVRHALHFMGFAILAALVLSAPALQARAATLLPAVSALRTPMAWHYPGSYGALGALLIFATLSCPGQLLYRLLAWLPFRALGIVSYGMYLIHVAVALALQRWGASPGLGLLLLTLVLTYGLANLSYALIERPFMRVRAR